MSKGLKTAAPPPRPKAISASNDKPAPKKRIPAKFTHVAEVDTVQFNRRIPRGTSDGFEMLAIKTRKKVPELLTEALELLEEKYGKV